VRISELEKNVIVSAIREYDPEAEIYLYGSRANVKSKGGDIDLLVLSTKLSFDDKLSIKRRIFDEIDEQKIDILIAKDSSDPFVKSALITGIKL